MNEKTDSTNMMKIKKKYFSVEEYEKLKTIIDDLSQSIVFFTPLSPKQKRAIMLSSSLLALVLFVALLLLSSAFDSASSLSIAPSIVACLVGSIGIASVCALISLTMLKSHRNWNSFPLYVFAHDALWQVASNEEYDARAHKIKLSLSEINYVRANVSFVVKNMTNSEIEAACFFLAAIRDKEKGSNTKGLAIKKIDSIEDILKTESDGVMICDLACEVDGEPECIELRSDAGDSPLAEWLEAEFSDRI